MKRTLAILAVLAVGTAASPAAVIGLFEWAFNIDGTVSNITDGDPLPGTVSDASWNATTGIGSLTVTITTAGAHHVSLFVDHEIDEAVNTFFNENGATSGAPAAGQSWEIDEPGHQFGDIYDHFDASTTAGSLLENANGVPVGQEDDPSMALGWDFSLGAGETATIAFRVSETAPSGFHLIQTDPESEEGVGKSIYFNSTLRITGDQPPGVPDGGATAALLGAALAGLVFFGQKARRRRG